MSKSIWSGYLKVGLLSVPVSVHAACGSEDDITFNQLHSTCLHKIKQKKVCSTCVDETDAKAPIELTESQIVKGYEYAKGKFAVITAEELAAVKVASTHVIDVGAFTSVPPDNALIEKTYYLVPNEEFGRQAYSVVLAAMRAKGNLQAVGTVQMFRKEYQVILTATEGGLQMQTLSPVSKLRPMSELSELATLPTANEAEVAIGVQIVSAYEKDVDYGEFKSTYTDSVKAMVAAKVSGQEYVAAEAPKASTSSLLEALQASLSAIKATTPAVAKPKAVKVTKVKKAA
jgi:DNA end-binding protein Ku